MLEHDSSVCVSNVRLYPNEMPFANKVYLMGNGGRLLQNLIDSPVYRPPEFSEENAMKMIFGCCRETEFYGGGNG
ncbi:MAG: hypothetical protein ACTTKL_07355 [Treponema sp.]